MIEVEAAVTKTRAAVAELQAAEAVLAQAEAELHAAISASGAAPPMNSCAHLSSARRRIPAHSYLHAAALVLQMT